MIRLTLSDEQAKLVARACEFYARVRCGQFDEITWEILMKTDPHATDFGARKDLANELLLMARKYLLPELHSAGHSYGIGKYDDVDRVWDVYQVIRTEFGDPRGIYSRFDDVPKIERVES